MVRADDEVTLSNVHRCCRSCTAGIKQAVESVAGATVTFTRDEVGLRAPRTEELQKAVDALCAAGYAGTSDNPAVKVTTGAGPDETVTSLAVTGTHLCCSGCTRAARAAAMSVAGVKNVVIETGATSFTVEGEFNGRTLMDALAKAGFNGTASR
jgi:hypothetical protein